jgi:hypothetical protein
MQLISMWEFTFRFAFNAIFYFLGNFYLMKTKYVLGLCSLLALAGCAGTQQLIQNPAGEVVKFSPPILGKVEIENAKFVLIEKSIEDGKYRVISMSAVRQPILNDRQERIAFNAAVTRFAPDFINTAFRTYTDQGNYGEETVVTACREFPLKIQNYSPCNSQFGSVFIPTGITKAYVAGGVSSAVMREWKEPALNHLRYVRSPEYALVQAGVFSRLAELSSIK